jgi:predicted nucleotidyltransferase component of viral defense system
MVLHEHPEDFDSLIQLTANSIGLPESAIRRDYFIVMLLQNLSRSAFTDNVVFKGGTSLSKCYPESISRFSEDIDLTYVPQGMLTDKEYDKALKHIEIAMIGEGFHFEKIGAERNARNKSSRVWHKSETLETASVKLEIGSSVRPDPYSKKEVVSYIQQFLESSGNAGVCVEFQLSKVPVQTLHTERTFLDKVLAVKRHALCGTLSEKVRHVYDVRRLFDLSEIQIFLEDTASLKALVQKTKSTDGFYLEKRDISTEYDPTGAFAFDNWCDRFEVAARARYELLHKTLLYTDTVQSFDEAIEIFNHIDRIFKTIDE